MGRRIVELLFQKNTSIQPGAILQCDSSEYKFIDWRDAVHYLIWCRVNDFDDREIESYHKWCDIYGYDENDKFIGKYNEYINCDFGIIFTSIGHFSKGDDLEKANAWE